MVTPAGGLVGLEATRRRASEGVGLMASVFVSHSSLDRAATEQVVERLRAVGFGALFVDFDPEQGIPAGRSWERELYTQLRRTDAVVFLASEASVISRWCFAELSLARSLGRPVFPLRLQPGVTLPLLADVQWTDLTDAGGGLAQLVAGLRSAGLDPADSFAWDPRRSPYPGLAPFSSEDAAVFFGRQPETRRLVELLTPTLQRGPGRFVAIVGPSGSGKSSLLRAGLLPRLARMPERWLLVPPLRPGRQPVPALAGSLARAFADHDDHRPTSEVAAVLHRGPGGLIELAGELSDLNGDGAGRPGVLVAIDQAEELLTRTAVPEQQAFLRLLDGALHEDSPVWAVATLRSEFLTTAPDRAGLAETVDDPLVIEPLSRNRLVEVITRPAQRAGLDFTPGLVERMVEDTAGGDALPLLGYTLHQLFQRVGREGTVTDSDYEAVGGVIGALQHRADQLADELTRRGLGSLVLPTLTRLAAVTGEERPSRRRVRRAVFSAEERVVIDAFVDASLLISDHDADSPSAQAVVEVAHDALLRQWSPLHDAIKADRHYLTWHAQLLANLAEWKGASEDQGRLLRGAPLADAEARAAERPDALTEEEHRYIAVSRAVARRGVRRWRIATTAIAVLALVASGLAIAARTQNRELADRVRLLAAVSLAGESMERLHTQPNTSLQFAQAAVQHDPDSAAAQAALLTQHARYGDQSSLRTDLWSQPLAQAATNDDGSVIAVAETDGSVTVWTGLLADRPMSWQVTSAPGLRGLELSPGGDRLAVFSERSGIDVWNVARRTGPVRLRPPEPADDPQPAASTEAEFSQDGRTLVVIVEPDHEVLTNANVDVVEIYDATSGRRLPSAIAPPGIVDIQVLRVDAGGRSVWLREFDLAGNARNVMRDIATGALERELPQGWVGADATVVSCSSQELSAVDAVTGAPRFRTRLPSTCPSDASLDSTGRYFLLPNGLGDDLFQLVSLVELQTGRTYQLQVPHTPIGVAPPTGGLVLVAPSPEGPELVVVGNVGVRRSRPAALRNDVALFHHEELLVGPAFNEDATLVAVHLDEAEQNHAGLEVYELPAQRRIAGGPGTSLADMDLHRLPSLTFTPDGRHLLARAENDDLLVLSTSDYTLRHRIQLPVPEELGSPTAPFGWNFSLVPLGSDDVAVLYAGAFTRWRLTTGDLVGDPLLLRDDATRLRRDAQQAEASGRPGHPGQVLVTMSDGVELWDLGARRAVRSFRPEPNTKMAGAVHGEHSRFVAVHTSSGSLYLWDPDHGRQVGEPGPLAADRRMVGIGPGELLVLETNDGKGGIGFWDIELGRNIATVDTPGVTESWHIAGDALLGYSDDGLLSLDLDRKTALARLCEFNDRPYTAEEANLLPDGAERTPPCRIAVR